MRRKKLRSIQSALDSHTFSSPPLAKRKTRVCSRKRPTIERTRMFSESFGTPGRSAHTPRTMRSTFTPACDAV